MSTGGTDIKYVHMRLYFQKERYYSSVEDEPKRSENEEKAMESKDDLASSTDETG